MRTDKEILSRIKELIDKDWLGFNTQDLIVRLPFTKAKEFLKPEAKEENWIRIPRNKPFIINEMKEYMGFALGKASDHRGISASRSIAHYHSWLWLIGDEELLTFIEVDENYRNYGAPILKAICDKYGFPFPTTTDLQNMAQGKPCYDGCDMGCGQ